MECFIINSGELEGRIDPSPYHPTRLSVIKKIKASKFKLLPLIEVAEFSKDLVTSKTDDLLYVGLENIEPNTGFFITSEEEKEIFGTALKFRKGDILFPKLRPYLNKVHLADFDGVCSTEFYVLKAKKCDNSYLFCFLNSQLVVNQTSFLMTGNTLPRLQTEEVENLLIPIPPTEIQKRIVEQLNKAREAKKSKESEAQHLFDSMSDYILDELGIKFPSLTEKMTYLVDFDEVKNHRCDAHYHQPKFEEVEKAISSGKFGVKELQEITESLINGFDFRDFVDEGITYIRVSNIRPNRFNLSNVMFVPNMKITKDIKLQEGDILLTRKGTYGVATVADKDSEKFIISSEIFRIVSKKGLNPVYLSAWLNSNTQQILFNRIKTGGIMGHLSQEALLQIKIPLPPISVQNKIADELKKRLQKAEQLQKEAIEIIEKAKSEVEKMIIS